MTDGLIHWLTYTSTNPLAHQVVAASVTSRPSSFLLLWQQHWLPCTEVPFALENWMFNAWVTGPTLTIYPTIVPQAPVETNIWTLQELCRKIVKCVVILILNLFVGHLQEPSEQLDIVEMLSSLPGKVLNCTSIHLSRVWPNATKLMAYLGLVACVW